LKKSRKSQTNKTNTWQEYLQKVAITYINHVRLPRSSLLAKLQKNVPLYVGQMCTTQRTSTLVYLSASNFVITPN